MAQENSTANASGVAARRTDGRRVSPAAAIAALAVVCVAGCASSSDSKFKAGARASDSSSSAKELDGGGAGASFGGGGGLNTLPDGGFADLDAAGAQIMCPQGVGAECNDQNCGNGTTTVITGRVLDPAAKNPVWNATVFVRDLSIPLPDLNGETLACGCGSYYPADVLGYAQTDANGAFTINSAPYGTNIDLVVQVGKWRMEYAPYTITRCATNTVPDLRLPRDSTEGTLPDIAISTGLSDSLECLPLRMGVSPSEYVGGGGGPGSTGHIHIFHGYGGANTDPPGPDSVQGLWDSTADLDKHDVVLLSCEGHETTGGGSAAMGGGGGAMTNQYQQILMDYANKGGRVFASHYQYAWFTQPRAEKTAAAFAAANLATWQGADGTSEELDDTVSFGTDIDTTLAGGGGFQEGTAMQAWLGNVGALTGGLLPVQYTRINVVSLNAPAVEWIHLDSATAPQNLFPGTNFIPHATQYFSVDTPLNATGASVCGRVVYSDLHVSGGPGYGVGNVPADYAGGGSGTNATAGTAPSGCSMHDLSPQELALEFMLFDLSSCLVPAVGTPQPPPSVMPPR